MLKKEAIAGVFSTQEIRKVGTGATSRKSVYKAFWYCTELELGADQGKIEIQPLNSNYIPAGHKRVVEREQFLTDFSPELEFYISTVFPRMREVNKTVARADRHRENKEYFSAEMEYNNALKVDEENVRANFGLGLTYLQRNEVDKAENIFCRLVKLDAAFESEHKHLFNEFGIQLRKHKMFTQAIEYYERALQLSSTDENLYYNIARACLENQAPAQATEMLLKGLNINPYMEEAARFLLWMLGKGMIPEEKKGEVAQVLKKIKEAQATGAAAASDVGTASDSGASDIVFRVTAPAEQELPAAADAGLVAAASRVVAPAAQGALVADFSGAVAISPDFEV